MSARGCIIVSALLMIVVASLSTMIGATSVTFADLLAILQGELPADNPQRIIFLELRLPRVITAAMVGASLAASGVGFQGLFRNPLAEPYIIGASSGASLGVALVVVSGLQLSFFSLGATALMAIVGAVAVVMLVVAIASATSIQSASSLLLAGIVVSSMVSAIVSGLMFIFDQRAMVILSWLMGSLASAQWGSAALVTLFGGIGMTVIGLSARALDVYSLGDVSAQSLGLPLRRFRWFIIVAASIATAGAVASSGIIGFIGLIAPHLARMLVGAKHAVLIPLSILLGATLVIVADVLARTVIAPAELPVGILTAILGCPFFLWLLLSNARSEKGMQ